jgi:integrase
VALYTGARSSSEIARIRLADIYEEQGVNVINLSLASKNVRSKRIVPIHPALIELGFLDYVTKLREKGKERLFPDWEPEDKINRWFLRTYKAEVGIHDSRKVFHSFRHTLKTALAHYGVNRDVSDLITGHKDQSVGGIYIGDQTVTMVKAMAEGLARVDFQLPI